MMFAEFLKGNTFFRWATIVRPQSDDASTSDAVNQKEEQRLKDEETEYETNIKLKILNASLTYVDTSGWSKQALAEGAESLGYPGIVHGLFPKGGVELVHHFYRQANLRLSTELPSDILEAQLDISKQNNDLKVLRNAIEKRLRMNTEHVITGRWTEALGMMALPTNAPSSLKLLSDLIDDMWYHAGDTSVDSSWYAKRVLLAAIYKTTELSMIQDNSDDFKTTWEFLDRRIEGLNNLRESSTKCREASVVVKGLYKTALNVIGVDSGRR